MADLDADLRFLLDTITDCPNGKAVRVCPLSSYRALDAEAKQEAIAKLGKLERQYLVRHCNYCIRFYGLTQHL